MKKKILVMIAGLFVIVLFAFVPKESSRKNGKCLMHTRKKRTLQKLMHPPLQMENPV
ncbi:MAG: hypothetical protein IPH68_04505 [Chitinophagaceae bacterium]|nr:hypothetical protein [Chitinophagaceae bacterium]